MRDLKVLGKIYTFKIIQPSKKSRYRSIFIYPNFQIFGSRKPPHQTGSYMFYALEPNSKYEVVVQSKNKWGWSQTSNPFFFNTRATGKISQSYIESIKVS